eukprot:GDKK01056066.1.p1 GENE.GDKK01056066.1~~GDKK01056066.1.p1  ORF type:complete len:121 (-),score=6.09 GDKK01056066.1:54-416(-)
MRMKIYLQIIYFFTLTETELAIPPFEQGGHMDRIPACAAGDTHIKISSIKNSLCLLQMSCKLFLLPALAFSNLATKALTSAFPSHPFDIITATGKFSFGFAPAGKPTTTCCFHRKTKSNQ